MSNNIQSQYFYWLFSRHSHEPAECLRLPVELHLERRELHHLLLLHKRVGESTEGFLSCKTRLGKGVDTVPHSPKTIEPTRVVHTCWQAALVAQISSFLQGCQAFSSTPASSKQKPKSLYIIVIGHGGVIHTTPPIVHGIAGQEAQQQTDGAQDVAKEYFHINKIYSSQLCWTQQTSPC